MPRGGGSQHVAMKQGAYDSHMWPDSGTVHGGNVVDPSGSWVWLQHNMAGATPCVHVWWSCCMLPQHSGYEVVLSFKPYGLRMRQVWKHQ
jgi:hypothetical protein